MKKLFLALTAAAFIFNAQAATSDIIANSKDGEASFNANCAMCHGAEGKSAAAAFPKLAGQNAKYVSKQLYDFKQGNRINALMAGPAAMLDDQMIADISQYLSEQSVSVGTAKAELVALGEKLYKAGNAATGVPACTGCHSPTGKGNASAGFPLLSGQHADYTIAQLKAFRLGYRAEAPSDSERVNGGEAKIMRTIAFKLKDFEIEALASYINGLH